MNWIIFNFLFHQKTKRVTSQYVYSKKALISTSIFLTHRERHTHTYTHTHIYTYTYIIANPEHTPYTAPAAPSPTPNMQLPAGYLQLKLILKNYQNVKSNSNIQTNDIMEKSFTHCTIDVISLVILICNKELLSSCPSKINMNKRG